MMDAPSERRFDHREAVFLECLFDDVHCLDILVSGVSLSMNVVPGESVRGFGSFM